MDAVAIGKKLRELRGVKSIKTVADNNGISVSALSMYECGVRIPRDEIKIRLASYYGTTVEELFFAKNIHESWNYKTASANG